MIAEAMNRSFTLRTLRRYLPARVKAMAVKQINRYRLRRLERFETPEAIVLFVTNRCQMGCPFCFYKHDLNIPTQQLTVAELERVADSLKQPPRLVLTGGEPFLNPQLADICRLFILRARTRIIGIPTNGLLTERIRDVVQTVLGQTRVRYFRVQISLDALGEQHDQLRKVPGAFERAIRTLTQLLELQRRHRNLYVEVAAVINTALIRDIDRYVRFFQPFRVPLKFSIPRDQRMGIYNLSPDIADHAIANDGAQPVTVEELTALFDQLTALNADLPYHFWSPFQREKFRYSLRIVQEHTRPFPCYAGKADAVIYPNGDVAVCENTQSIGNLRDFGYDFAALWHSGRADLMRQRTTQCACINGCNLVTSMSYSDEAMLQVAHARP